LAARRLDSRARNELLQELITESGCSNVGLARRVNLEGGRRGLDLRYDKTSVSRWLRGQRPRGQTPLIIAEVLGQKLGRRVSVEEIGMTAGEHQDVPQVGLTFAPTLTAAVEEATGLWRTDAAGRRLPSAPRLAISTLLEPSRDWLIAEPESGTAHEGTRVVTSADIETTTHVTRSIADLDHRFGSGDVRPLAVHYLDAVVSAQLRGGYGSGVGRQLCGAAARLSELAGYMAVDSGRPALAHRYYIQALRLAHAADDRGFGGYVLAAGLGRLAAELGHPREVAQLARAAREGSRDHIGGAVRSCLLAAEARGYALLGDARQCDLAMARAEEALEQAEPDQEPPWIRHFGRGYLADDFAHCHLDLGRPQEAARCAEQALATHPEYLVRRRAVGLLLLATAHVAAGAIDEGCARASEAVTMSAGLRSAIVREHLEVFRSRVGPDAEEPAVRAFEARLRELSQHSPGVPGPR
jgi:hypothetical protein